MLDKRMFELLNQEVDGTNSSKGSQEVRAFLARNFEARQTFDALRELSVFLKKTPQLEPPRSLKTRILNSLPGSGTSPQRLFPVFALVRKLTEGTNVRYAYTFAGGAVAGILLFAFLTGSPSDTSSLVGAIGSDPALTSPLRSVEINLPEVDGNLAADYEGNTITATASFTTSEQLGVVLTFDQEKLQFENFVVSDPATSSVTVHAGRLELRGSGTIVCKFIFARKSADAVALNANVLINGAKRSDLYLPLEQSSH